MFAALKILRELCETDNLATVRGIFKYNEFELLKGIPSLWKSLWFWRFVVKWWNTRICLQVFLWRWIRWWLELSSGG